MLLMIARLLLAPFFIAITFASEIPELETAGSERVVITHPGLDAQWLIRFPEAIATPEAYYLNWEPISVDWKSYGKGEIGYEWEASREWLERAKKLVEKIGYTVLPGLHLSTRMRPFANRVDLSITIRNLTDKPLGRVWCEGGDLQHQSDRFIDDDASRTFVKTSEGLTRLSDVHRTNRIRSWYFFEPRWNDSRPFTGLEYFWGRSQARPSSALIASAAVDGRGAVGIGYEHSMVLMQNSDNHHCMHSAPYFGTVPPQQKVSRRGVILFGSTVEELFERFEKLGYEPDFTPPES